MATTLGDFKIAAVAAGFTLGFGFLTVWTAIKQTMRARTPWQSAYIWMIWGEIAANMGIGILGWLFLEGIIPPGIPILFGLLFFWVFEIQLLMQIIINRVYVVAENRTLVIRVKWITAAVITVINVMVFCIWIPAHLVPPPSENFTIANKYWDPASKVLICLIDAALNVWFVRITRQRLVRYHGLEKYAALVRFNSYLMVVSVGMDVMLIGLMFLKNQLVYVQFHPVTYMIKLNIEMSMASLITKLARQTIEPDFHESLASNTYVETSGQRSNVATASGGGARRGSTLANSIQLMKREQNKDSQSAYKQKGSIHTTTDIFVHREEVEAKTDKTGRGNRASLRAAESKTGWDDDLEPLRGESPDVSSMK
ncbi:hypothetical protein FQN54_007128 [Arachnomyces sp. PD_36]|nr:hypothetical protein FQN54_007128 [Arachnomyces sp. PD_36]